MSHPNYPIRRPQAGPEQRYGLPDGLTPEERAAADAAVARLRAERDVADADARGRAIADPYGPAPRHGATAAVTQPVAPVARNGLGLAAAIVAPVGIVFGLVPLTGFIAVICALVAVPLALVGWSRVRRGKATNGKTAMTGLVLGAGALALGVWGMTIVFGAVDQLAEDLSGPAPIAAPAVPGPAGQQPVIEAERPAGATGPLTTAFGQRATFDDGLAVEVSTPQPYKPSRYAAGHDGDRAVTFDITVVNGSDEPYDAVMTVVNATHGGRQVSRIFDSANGGSENPAGTVLPGKSTTFTIALSLGEAVDELQLEVTPGFLGEPAIFTGQV
ncbi:DUF4190 domain-containing protein [Pseudonocardia adelaidensis]|uniref:DUF4352 domain-containing protein n=1 Tax=Pseudonocardia adelaidensis TaxID=648754 RepID=A0ABP9NVQ0_9PSEU